MCDAVKKKTIYIKKGQVVIYTGEVDCEGAACGEGLATQMRKAACWSFSGTFLHNEMEGICKSQLSH